MKIAVILRELPIPIHTGINLIINNVCKRIINIHQVKLFIIDQGYYIKDNKHELLSQPNHINNQIKHFTDIDYFKNKASVKKLNSSCQLSRIDKYYRTDIFRLSWLKDKIQEFKPDRILGFDYNLLGYFGLLNTSTPKVLNVIDSEILFIYRELKRGNISIKNLKHLVASILHAKKHILKCDSIITVAHQDTINLKKITGFKKIYTIPNGVDNDFFCPDEKIIKVNKQIVFSGSLNWSPNQEAIKWFVKNCWDIIIKKETTATLIIIGKSPPNHLQIYLESFKNVKVLGFVNDIRDYIRSSQVSIAPMVSGSGIKNKILEAWALGTSIISTPLGVKGLEHNNEENILLADSPISFSHQVIRLLNDHELRKRISAEGRRHVVEKYSWQKSVDLYVKLLESCNHSHHVNQ